MDAWGRTLDAWGCRLDALHQPRVHCHALLDLEPREEDGASDGARGPQPGAAALRLELQQALPLVPPDRLYHQSEQRGVGARRSRLRRRQRALYAPLDAVGSGGELGGNLVRVRARARVRLRLRVGVRGRGQAQAQGWAQGWAQGEG